MHRPGRHDLAPAATRLDRVPSITVGMYGAGQEREQPLAGMKAGTVTTDNGLLLSVQEPHGFIVVPLRFFTMALKRQRLGQTAVGLRELWIDLDRCLEFP